MTPNETLDSIEVLILGDPQDKVTQAFQERSQQHGYGVTLYHREIESPLSLTVIPDVILYLYSGYQEADQALLMSALDQLETVDETVILVSALGQGMLDIADSSADAERMVGLSPLGLYTGHETVEVAPNLLTQESALAVGSEFLERLGLEVFTLESDSAGLVFPRVLSMLVNEAVSALMESVATPEDIDNAMRYGTNYPEGPLSWADQVGLDVILDILSHLYEEYGEERYRPMPLLKQMVLAGLLGQKTGQGFYDHADLPQPATVGMGKA